MTYVKKRVWVREEPHSPFWEHLKQATSTYVSVSAPLADGVLNHYTVPLNLQQAQLVDLLQHHDKPIVLDLNAYQLKNMRGDETELDLELYTTEALVKLGRNVMEVLAARAK